MWGIADTDPFHAFKALPAYLIKSNRILGMFDEIVQSAFQF